MEFQRNLFQVNGWDYQLLPTQPSMIKEDIRKAAGYKILRILLQHQFQQKQHISKISNQGQRKSPKFDLILSKKSTIILIPSLNIPLPEKFSLDIEKFQSASTKQQYFLKEVEEKLIKMLNFLTIQQISSVMSFIIVEQVLSESQQTQKSESSNEQTKKNKKYRLYITWIETSNSIFINYQSHILENIFNPYTNFILIFNNKEYKYQHARYFKMNHNKLKIFGIQKALSLLADFYLNRNYDVVYQLYDGTYGDIVKDNKNLLINLLTTLYNEVDDKSYQNYLNHIGKSSGIIPQPKTVKPSSQSPALIKRRSSKQQKIQRKISHKKQISETKDMRYCQRISQFSMDIVNEFNNSYGSMISKNQVSVRNQEEKEEFSDLGENVMSPLIRQKNKIKDLYVLGQQHEYLLKPQQTKQKKQKKYISNHLKVEKKYSYLDPTQIKKQQFDFFFNNITGKPINFSLYLSIKKNKSSIQEREKKIERPILRKMGAYFLTQTIENIIVFSRYYLIMVGELDKNEVDRVDIKFCEILLQKMIQNYFSQIDVLIQEATNKDRGGHIIFFLQQAWSLLNQLIFLAIRYNIANPAEFQRKVQQKRSTLYKYSQKLIKQCKQNPIEHIDQETFISQHKDEKMEFLNNEKQQFDEKNLISFYTAWIINRNLELIFSQSYREILVYKFTGDFFNKVIQIYKENNKCLKYLLQINSRKGQQFFRKISMLIINFFIRNNRLYFCRKFNLTNQYNHEIDVQLPVSIHESYVILNIIGPGQINRKTDQNQFAKLDQNLLMLTCLNNFFVDKVCQDTTQAILKQGKYFLFQWLNLLAVSKNTVKWVCRSKNFLAPYLDPFKPRIYALLTLYCQLYHIPAYLPQFALIEFGKNLQQRKLMQKIQGCLDSLKKHIDENHHKKQYINLYGQSDQYILTFLIMLISSKFQFFQYRQEVQEMTIKIFDDLVGKDQKEVMHFLYSLTRVAKKINKQAKIVQLIIKHAQIILQQIEQHIEKAQAINPQYLQKCRAIQEDYESVEKSFNFSEDSAFLQLLQWFERDIITKKYFQLKQLIQYIALVCSSFYNFQSESEDLVICLNKFYNKLKQVGLVICQIQCLSLEIMCETLNLKLEKNPKSEKNTPQEDAKLLTAMYNRNKQKLNQNLSLLLSFLNKIIFFCKNDWTSLFEQCYQTSVSLKNNHQFYLNQYIYKLEDSYIDRLLENNGMTLKSSSYLYLIGIQFLRHRKIEGISIDKQFLAFRFVCQAMYKNVKIRGPLRMKYHHSILSFISAKLFSITCLRKSKMYYQKVYKSYKYISPYMAKFFPIVNCYHKIHRLYEKFEKEVNYRYSTGRKIYKSLCSKCGFIIHKDIRHKRVFIGIINRIRKIEQNVGLQQKV